MCKKVKIEIELALDKKIEIDIISKAFNLSPREFVDLILKNELCFIKSYLNLGHPKENLEDYYKFEINIDELKKLILLEEVM